jgi:hypothetical protein
MACRFQKKKNCLTPVANYSLTSVEAEVYGGNQGQKASDNASMNKLAVRNLWMVYPPQ